MEEDNLDPGESEHTPPPAQDLVVQTQSSDQTNHEKTESSSSSVVLVVQLHSKGEPPNEALEGLLLLRVDQCHSGSHVTPLTMGLPENSLSTILENELVHEAPLDAADITLMLSALQYATSNSAMFKQI